MKHAIPVVRSLMLGTLVSSLTFMPAVGMAATTPATDRTAKKTANAATACAEICTNSLVHNFGGLAEGSSASYGVNVTNGYTTTVPFSVTTTGSASITVANGCGSTIKPGETCTLTVTYAVPKDVESDSVTVTLASSGNAFNNGTSGSFYGYSKTAGTTSSGSINVSTQKHNFGAVNFNTPQFFGWNIENGTSSAQTVTVGAISGSAGYSVFSNTCPASLASGASCEVVVLYAPKTTTGDNATLSLSASAPVYVTGTTTSGSTLTLAGSGTGTISLNSAIQHIIVIFDENISFDHYYGTYPSATGQDGTTFSGSLGSSQTVNNYQSNPSLLTSNPNLSNSGNGNGATNPYRLSYAQGSATASQNHSYGPEQEAQNNSAMNAYPEYVGAADSSSYPGSSGISATKGLNLGYYDGNTVTALWNYAQRFSLSDSHYGSTFGPSTPGAINVVSGQTNGIANKTGTSNLIADGQGGYSLYGDDDPYGDTCSTKTGTTVQMSGKSIGDLLNTAGITWGAFMGGFNLGLTNANGTTGCARSTIGKSQAATGSPAYGDYIQHHAWFQYYASTLNASHARPTSIANIGQTDAALHEYDSQDFFAALGQGILPSVSFLKAPAYQDAHAGYSNPLDEQAWIASVVNAVQQSYFWPNTAIIITYDDSDGWYDHVYNAPVNGSFTTQDFLNGTGTCGVSGTTPMLAGPGSNGAPVQGRCGYGPRIPLTVISPWAKKNYVDHTTINQASVLRFIEDHMLNSARIGGGSFDATSGVLDNMFDLTDGSAPNVAPLLINPTTGAPQ